MRILRIGLYCLLGGLSLTPIAMGVGGFAWCWLAALCSPLRLCRWLGSDRRRTLSQFGVIAPVLLIVTVLCLWSEALIFVQVPEIQQHAVPNLIGAAVIYLIFAMVLSVLAVILKLPRGDDAPAQLRRPAKSRC